MTHPIKDTIINGVTFRIALLDGIAGRRLMFDSLRVFGAALSGLMSGSSDVSTFLGVGSNAKPEDVDRIITVLGEVSQVEVKPGAWMHLTEEVQRSFFTGRQKLQLAWVGKALGVQLADFFDEKKSG